MHAQLVIKLVGWAEQGEAHRFPRGWFVMGFAALNPSGWGEGETVGWAERREAHLSRVGGS